MAIFLQTFNSKTAHKYYSLDDEIKHDLSGFLCKFGYSEQGQNGYMHKKTADGI